MQEIILYQDANGKVKIVDLFGVDRIVITKHLKNIFVTNEFEKDSVCAKIADTA